MNGGFIKLDSGSYLNIDHIISFEPITDGNYKVTGTMFFTNDPSGGMVKYEDKRSPEEIVALIKQEKGDYLVSGEVDLDALTR